MVYYIKNIYNFSIKKTPPSTTNKKNIPKTVLSGKRSKTANGV